MLAARLARNTAAAARAVLSRAGSARAMAAEAAAFSPDALETEVGISVFANSSKGFTAVLKHRWSDFIVNEIGLDGRLAALKLLPQRAAVAPAAPAAVSGEAAAAGDGASGDGAAGSPAAGGADETAAAAAAAAAHEAEAAAAAEAAPPRPSPSDDPSAALAAFGAVVSAADTEALRAWIAACAAAVAPQAEGEEGEAAPRRPPPLLFTPTGDKQLRTRLHGLVRMHLRWAESDVADDGESVAGPKSIRLRCTYKGPAAGPKRARAGGSGRDAKRSRAAPQVIEVASGPGCSFDAMGSPPPYLTFVLMKENVDTGNSLSIIASMLRVPPRTLGFAGTKDKRGVTAQRLSWRYGDVAQLKRLNARLIGMRVGAAERATAPLGLGALRGNRFALTLRDVRGATPADVASALGALRSRGFVNYFGLQRFGSGPPGSRTHSVGAALLRGAWPEAIDRLLGAPRPNDRPEIAAARLAWSERRDAKAALDGFPVSALAERAVLRRFAQPGWDGRNFVGALTAIPKTMRMMYVHAYQSYLWNHAAAVRVERYDMTAAVEGDLVYEDWAADEYDEHGLVITAAAAQAQAAAEAAAAASAADDGDADTGFGDGDDDCADGDAAAEATRTVRHVTAEEAASRAVPITAVLLPLPAAGVLYPGNDVAEAYTSRAAADGVSLSGGQHSVREFSLAAFSGGYRRLLQRPGAMAWRLLRYDCADDELARTAFGDALVAEGRRPPPPEAAMPPPGPECMAANAAAEAGDAAAASSCVHGADGGKFTALQLSFALPSAAYATMLVRELLKAPTSADYHRGIGTHEA